ncbi:MAG TPA: dihydrodipicolinate reductase C-terminal domain-containing protein [Parachlamydiaceae bacterium]|nr:dihydrodipicolinate reductase C-terminal domain-containing protein [Parachlamydiaceae bacterium]
MKIALIGYGRIGKLINELAIVKGYPVVAIMDSKYPLAAAKTTLCQADVCIDFSTPHAVLENVKFLTSIKKDIVMGTTGWHEHLPEIKKLVEESKIGFLHSPNFSLGIALFLRIIEQTAGLMGSFEQYQAAGIEVHHSKKLDSPSGTAKAIESRLNCHAGKAVAFTSVRVGDTPGTHSVIYDSPVDTITLTHSARNREGFAQGALTAAEWLVGKKGMFTLDELLKEKLK